MKKPKLPRTDSIKKLAAFWDKHDVTDFEEELEDVSEPVFSRKSAITINLKAQEAEVVGRLAQAKGVSREELIRAWVVQRVNRQKNGHSTQGKKSKTG